MTNASNRKRNALTLAAVFLLPMGDAIAQRGGRRAPAPIPVPRQQPPTQETDPQQGGGGSFALPAEFRTIDGRDNNFAQPDWGSAEIEMLRTTGAHYADASGSPAGPDRASTRAISNVACAQAADVQNSAGATDYLWQWGQFLDHDIVETPASDPAEAFDIPVPAGDPWFDPQSTGTQIIPLNRSLYDDQHGTREQVNAITAFIDASNVYGSDEVRAYALRTLDGTGMLRTTESEHGDLLPYNTSGLPNAPGGTPNFFFAGDVRANEQAALTCLHTLFVREHNSWAANYAEANPAATGDEIYEFARLIVGAEMQSISYREFLPVLLGQDALPPFQGYRAIVNPGIANEFATAAYRIGHTMLSSTLRRIGPDGQTVEAGDLPLAAAFFDPSIVEENGIDSLLRGLASQRCQEVDGLLVDDVRNFLFGPPGSGGFDLAALNMQRGRDHGLPSYNQACAALGLRPARRFADINPDPQVTEGLASVYDSPDQVDLWIGGLCEPHVPGAMLGPLFRRIIADQFTRLRDGDRFWYQEILPEEMVTLVENQTLATIIRRNTGIGDELPDNVFRTGPAETTAPAPRRPRRR